MKNKVISFVLTLSLLLSVCVLGFSTVNAKEESTITIDELFKRYEEYYKDGYKVPSSEEFLQAIANFGQLYEEITGRKFISNEKVSIVVEDFLVDIQNSFKEQSNSIIDFQLLVNNLTITNFYAKEFYRVTNIDKDALVSYLNEKSEYYYQENNETLGSFYLLLRVYMNMFNKLEVMGKPVEGKEGVYEIVLRLDYVNGDTEDLYPGIYYDANTTYLYNRNGKGLLNLGFDMKSEDATLFTVIDSWQRNFGYCMFYDIFSYLTPFFDYTTRRIKFEYDNKEWMIQIWKGRYIVTAGCEVGVYTRDKGSFGTYYNCASDEDMLPISVELYHDDELILSRETQTHWWFTCFRFTPKCYLPESLTLLSQITFKDEEMTNAFVGSVKHIDDVRFLQNGNVVTIKW